MSKKQDILNKLADLVSEDGELMLTQNYELPFQVGEAYLIRTVTYFLTGRVKAIVGKYLILEDAAWIADTGRFADAMKSGDFSEVEPVEVQPIVNTDSIVDAFPFKHDLPRKQK